MDFFHPPSAEDLLLRQAGQGQPQALAQLVRRYQALAYTVALRVVGNPQDAEEVVQDAFLKAFAALARLPPEDALVLTLHYLGEQSIAELCVILGKKTSAIKMQLLRSRKQLEQALTQLLPTEYQHLL